MVHGCMRAELSAVVEEVAIGAVKPWQKAAAVAATQRDSDSLMVANSLSICVCREREERRDKPIHKKILQHEMMCV